jgi:hypothetical protein
MNGQLKLVNLLIYISNTSIRAGKGAPLPVRNIMIKNRFIRAGPLYINMHPTRVPL